MSVNPKKEFKSKKDLKIELLENKIEAKVGRFISNMYRGYEWEVTCKSFSGVVEIKNLTIHGEYGFLLHLKDLVKDVDLVTVKHAGGELLERCGLPATMRPDNLEQYITRDIKGNAEMDTHGAT